MRGRTVRLAGWAVALNAVAVLVAAGLGVPVREAAGQFALWCGLG
jgi:hypothetical protein